MKSKYIQIILFIVLMVTIVNIFAINSLISSSYGLAEQINNIGRIRGGVQRVTKLELSDIQSNILIADIDRLIDDVLTITKENRSISTEITDNLEKTEMEWERLKSIFYQYRSDNTQDLKDAMIYLSEEFWQFLDDTVTLVQLEDEKNANSIKYFVSISVLYAIALMMIIVYVRRYVRNELEVSANRDYLTKLYNRKFLTTFMEIAINKHTRDSSDMALMMVDIDDFKYINDTLGHGKGDKVLFEVGQIFLESVRASDVVCRYGGDEFSILLTDTDPEAIMLVAEKIRKAVGSNVFFGIGSVTVSIGICVYEEGDSITAFFEKADQAMYTAKQNGKNEIVIYTTEE